MQRLRLAVVLHLVSVLAAVFFIPAEFVHAQSVTAYPRIKQSLGFVEWIPALPVNPERFVPSPVLSDSVIRLNDVSSKIISHKLNVLADALMNQNIRGLARLKTDEFTGNYIAAIGIELKMWLESHGKKKYFFEIFNVHESCVIMLLAMSPASMHEYFLDLDLPGTTGDILEANKLPSSLTVIQEGGNVIVEVMGTDGLQIIFSVNQRDEVSVTS